MSAPNPASTTGNPGCCRVELSHSHHREFSYGRHVHLDYHIGLVQQGGQKFIHKGNSHHLVRGELSTVNPDEMHDGLSLLPEGYEVRVFAIAPEQLARWLPDSPEPFFDQGLQRRPDLYQGFARLHMYLDNPSPDGLLAESELLALLGELLHLAPERHALADPSSGSCATICWPGWMSATVWRIWPPCSGWIASPSCASSRRRPA
jgi:hypothetical protein